MGESTLKKLTLKKLSARVTLIIFVLLMALQLFLTLSAFNSKEDIVNDKPVLNVDWCSQYYWAHSAKINYEKTGRMWGYDPYFMAGYPLSFVFNSSLPVQISAVVFDEVSISRVIKACFIISFLLAPFSFYFSMKQFGLENNQALAACVLGTVYFWLGENAWFGHMGMISGAFILHFYLVPLSLFYRFLKLHENRAFSLLLFSATLAFTVHKTAFVLLIPISGLWFVMYSGYLSRREWGMLIGLVIFVALFNMHWLYPFFKFLPLKIEDAATTHFQSEHILRFITDLAPVPPYQPFYALPIAKIMLIALGVIGIRELKGKDDHLVYSILLAMIFLFSLTYFGSFFDKVRHLQPYRYVSSLYYLWLPLAGTGIFKLYGKFSKVKGGKPAAIFISAAIMGILLFALPNFRFFSKIAPLSTKLDGDSQAVLEWVKNNTDQTGRILIEDINKWTDKPGAYTVYGGTRFVQMLPIWTRRELIGGPFPNAFIKHHYADFHDGILTNERIKDFTDKMLDDTFKMYNIGWVVCWSDDSEKRFSSYPGVKDKKQFGGLFVFSIERERSFFLEGSGTVESEIGYLTLKDVVPEKRKVVIAYHWVDDLITKPDAELFQVMTGDDPVGFIGIKNPPKELKIRLGN